MDEARAGCRGMRSTAADASSRKRGMRSTGREYDGCRAKGGFSASDRQSRILRKRQLGFAGGIVARDRPCSSKGASKRSSRAPHLLDVRRTCLDEGCHDGRRHGPRVPGTGPSARRGSRAAGFEASTEAVRFRVREP